MASLLLRIDWPEHYKFYVEVLSTSTIKEFKAHIVAKLEKQFPSDSRKRVTQVSDEKGYVITDDDLVVGLIFENKQQVIIQCKDAESLAPSTPAPTRFSFPVATQQPMEVDDQVATSDPEEEAKLKAKKRKRETDTAEIADVEPAAKKQKKDDAKKDEKASKKKSTDDKEKKKKKEAQDTSKESSQKKDSQKQDSQKKKKQQDDSEEKKAQDEEAKRKQEKKKEAAKRKQEKKREEEKRQQEEQQRAEEKRKQEEEEEAAAKKREEEEQREAEEQQQAEAEKLAQQQEEENAKKQETTNVDEDEEEEDTVVASYKLMGDDEKFVFLRQWLEEHYQHSMSDEKRDLFYTFFKELPEQFQQEITAKAAQLKKQRKSELKQTNLSQYLKKDVNKSQQQEDDPSSTPTKPITPSKNSLKALAAASKK